MATKHTFKENVLRVIAVIGLIAVLLLGAWGIIQLAFFIPGFLSGLANGTGTKTVAKETLSVAVPVAVNAESAFPVTWTHKNASGAYAYSVSYACVDGLSVKSPVPTGTWQDVKCNTPFNYLNATTSLPVVALATGSKAVTATFTVTATKLSSGAVTATASGSTSVTPKASTTKTTTTKTTTTTKKTTAKTSYVAAPRTTNLYGQPDLQVRMLSNPGTVSQGAQVPLQFVVENVGTNVAPANWIFTANLPYPGGYTYQSPAQQALYPGDKIVFTLTFTAPMNAQYGQQYPNYSYTGYYNPVDPYGYSYGNSTLGGYSYAQPTYPNYYGGMQTATVTVDPYGLVWESNKTNNTASVSFQVY